MHMPMTRRAVMAALTLLLVSCSIVGASAQGVPDYAQIVAAEIAPMATVRSISAAIRKSCWPSLACGAA